MLMATPKTMVDAILAIDTLEPFINLSQVRTIASHVRDSEERQYFIDMACDLAERINSMPKTHEQDGKGDDAIVYLHYFLGGMDWYITEKDKENEQLQAFGYADLGYGGELGYISIVELLENNIELDLHWTPKPLSECK